MTRNYNLRLGALPYAGIALSLIGFFVLLDAAFELSKASFFSRLGAFETISVIVISAAILSLPAAVLTGVLKLIFSVSGKKAAGVFKFSINLIFSTALALIVFVHADTLAYTTFKVNSANLPAAARLFVLAAIIAMSVLISVRFGAGVYDFFNKYPKSIAGLYVLLFASLSAFTFAGFEGKGLNAGTGGGKARASKGLPNIILFTVDGLDAGRMSAYGYGRKTTPVLDEIAKASLVYKRAFSNSGNSRGSVISILTGKSPLTTKVLYPPDILLNNDAFEHLPGILSDMGYYCIDMNDEGYVSSGLSNMLYAFHDENGRPSQLLGKNPFLARLMRMYNMEIYFLSGSLNRYLDRIGFISGLSDKLMRMQINLKGLGVLKGTAVSMDNMKNRYNDSRRIGHIIDLLQRIDRPLFVRIHMLATHGPFYYNTIRHFSANKRQDKPNDADFYDDAILTVDYYFDILLKGFFNEGKFNTLIVFHTDHGSEQSKENTLPLIVHLPGQKKGKYIEAPVQYMDIAPSILNYIGADMPEWMEGSVIFPETDENALKQRPIYMIEASLLRLEAEGYSLIKKNEGPPFFGVKKASVVKNTLLYSLDLESGEESIKDFTDDPLSPLDVDDEAIMIKYREGLLSYLNDKGIDISKVRFKEQVHDE
jgi:hypothetical protein